MAKTGWGWAVYYKHTGSKRWIRIGSYQFKGSATSRAKEIREESKYFETKVHKVKLRTVTDRK